MPQLTWLITGCSSGFGEQFVRDLLERGDQVIASVRSGTSRLSSLKDAGAAIIDLDINAPRAQIDEAIKQAVNIYGGIDVLVNNAAYIVAGMAEEIRCQNTNPPRARDSKQDCC